MSSSTAQLELMRRCLDGEASDDEFAQLEQRLRNDTEIRKTYLRYVNVDSALAALPKRFHPSAGYFGLGPCQHSQTTERGWFGSHGLTGWIAMSAVVVMLVGVLIHQTVDGNRSVPQHERAGQDVAPLGGINDTGVAVLTRVAGLEGATTKDWRVGQTVSPGLMAWDAGLMQLEFYGGATVVAEGPARIEILDESRIVCQWGRLRAHVPEPARGFAVLAPSFELVDLGTEFGLNVLDDGVSEVHVFDGKVELYDAESNRSPASRRELRAGDALTIDRDGTTTPATVRDIDFVTSDRLSTMADHHHQEQLHSWRALRESLQDDPRVIAYFPFEKSDTEDRLLIGDGVGGTTIEGAIVGCEWAQGRWPNKSSLQFKRPGDRVRITIPDDFEALTYSTWVRVDGLDRTRNSLLMTDGFGKNGIHWQIRQDGSLTLGMRYANERVHNYHTRPIFNLFRLGQWVHLATVYDTGKGQVTHYVNGEPAERLQLQPFADGELKIGNSTIGNWSGRGASDVRSFNGSIDELIIFSQALDGQEVRRIYEAGRP
ncbi:FecR protein [Novipirellula aureliae]|uniref:FecR protein n=1 Tax=Novipirellula aureliae TaxID=2527966 RepID=A0A5C6DV88_9BACT|nr:LamG-like jellyroll fold domain-containing protein [Novipirellula aureliae]TWU38709.1 FecR protein [Novipirellula aureliae]